MEMRSQAEIDAERDDERRHQAVAAIIDASKAPDGGAFGYEMMLASLFTTMAANHGTAETVETVFEALKPIIQGYGSGERLRVAFEHLMHETGHG